MTLPEFYHRGVRWLSTPKGEMESAGCARFCWVLGEDVALQSEKALLGKRDRGLRGEFSGGSGSDKKEWVLTKSPIFRGDCLLAPQAKVSSNRVQKFTIRNGSRELSIG